jgi:hypothetical protein
VRVVCVNYGTTDAQLIEYGVDFLLVRHGGSLPPDHQFAFHHAISTVLKPGISGPFPDLVQPIAEDTEIAVRKGKADFYCIGYPDSLYQTSNEPFHSSKLMHRAGDGNGLCSVQLRHLVFMNGRFAPTAAVP